MGSKVAGEKDMASVAWGTGASDKKKTEYDLLNSALCDNYVRNWKV